VLPGLLLALGAVCHETTLLSLPALLLQHRLRAGRWTAGALALSLPPLAAFALLHLSLTPANPFALSTLLAWARIPFQSARGVVALLLEYGYGLGGAVALAPAGFAALKRLRLWPMLLLLPVYMAAVLPLEGGRLVVPASLPVSVGAALALSRLPRGARRWSIGLLVVSALAVYALWTAGRFASFAYLGGAVTLSGTMLCSLWRARRARAA
jgi:hypothetical protein